MNVINLKNQNKRYCIEDSPFYLIKGKNQLASLLYIKLDELDELLKINSYNVFCSKGREIQSPKKCSKMKKLHDRINNLFARIEVPDYLISPRKGMSYIDNAKKRIGAEYLIKTDISKFFPNTSFHLVKKMFLDIFKCAVDIATILAKICCYEQKHIPTGSSLSSRIAFFSAKNMFDEIEAVCTKNNYTLSVYVDDITMSGNNLNRNLFNEVKDIINKYGYLHNIKKTRYYAGKNQSKVVTGVVIKGDKVFLPNKRHKKIWELKQEYDKTSDIYRKHVINNRLICMKREASKII